VASRRPSRPAAQGAAPPQRRRAAAGAVAAAVIASQAGGPSPGVPSRLRVPPAARRRPRAAVVRASRAPTARQRSAPAPRRPVGARTPTPVGPAATRPRGRASAAGPAPRLPSSPGGRGTPRLARKGAPPRGGFVSRAQWRWSFATRQPWARRTARKTAGGPTVRYRRLPARKGAPTARTLR
jgi:hypothetical protein